MVQVLTAFEY